MIRRHRAFSVGKHWHCSVIVNGAANEQARLRNTKTWSGKWEPEHAFVTDNLTSDFAYQKKRRPSTNREIKNRPPQNWESPWLEGGIPTMNRLLPKARGSSIVLRKRGHGYKYRSCISLANIYLFNVFNLSRWTTYWVYLIEQPFVWQLLVIFSGKWPVPLWGPHTQRPCPLLT